MTTATQADFWNTLGAERWIRQQRVYDGLFGRHGDAAFDAADLRDGDAVFDVGCGCGTTTLDIGKRVAPRGRVLGVDISAPMLAVARRNATASGTANVQFEVADAQSRTFASDFDAVVSRLGIMFFDDPAAAFGNLRRALGRGGRFAAVCWRSPAENPWITLPQTATRAFLPLPAPADPHAPGPFSLADRDRLVGLLSSAGFRSPEVSALDLPLQVGAHAGEAARVMVELGPVGRALDGASEDVRRRATDGIAALLGPYETSAGVRVPSAAWLVTARAE